MSRAMECSIKAGIVFSFVLYVLPVKGQLPDEQNTQLPCFPEELEDTDATPRRWCDHNALHTLDSSCDVTVVETIRMPWWNGTGIRTVNVLDGQSVDPVSLKAFRIEADGRPKEGKASSLMKDPPKIDGKNKEGTKQVFITFSDTARSKNATVWRVEYKLISGVMQYSYCENDGVTNPGDTSDMAVIWRPEGVMVEQLGSQNVSFRALSKFFVPSLQNSRVIDDGFSFTKEEGLSDEERRWLVNLRQRLRDPYKSIEFTRFSETRFSATLSYMVTNGIEGKDENCPVKRRCEAEAYFAELTALAKAKEEKSKAVVHIGTISLAAVAGVAVVLSILAFVFLKKRKKRKMEEVYALADEDEPQLALPGVLREEDAGEDAFSLDAGSPREKNSDFWAKAGGDPNSSGKGQRTGGHGAPVMSPKSLLREDFENATLHASPPKHQDMKGNAPKSTQPQSTTPRSGARRRREKEAAAVSPKDLLRKDFESCTLEVDNVTKSNSRGEL